MRKLTPMMQKLMPLILNLRRKTDVEQNWAEFRNLVESDTNKFCEQINTRWLVSVCDTYVDLGNDVERRNAMLISMLTNMEKVGQSYLHWRVNYTDPFKVPDDYEPQKINLWDGMTSMHLEIGDVTNNLFRRLEMLLAETPHLEAIYRVIVGRMRINNTILAAIDIRHKHVFDANVKWRESRDYDVFRAAGWRI